MQLAVIVTYCVPDTFISNLSLCQWMGGCNSESESLFQIRKLPYRMNVLSLTRVGGQGSTTVMLLDRSLMIGWRKIWKILKPWKGVLCIHFRVCLSVCLSVCPRATEHTFWPRNLIFGLKDPWDMRKKRNFLFFEILKNGIFRVIFCVLLPHYLIFVGHIIWITVFGLFDWCQFAYHLRLKWLMLIDRIFFYRVKH